MFLLLLKDSFPMLTGQMVWMAGICFLRRLKISWLQMVDLRPIPMIFMHGVKQTMTG
jgi:hypothetical protein